MMKLIYRLSFAILFAVALITVIALARGYRLDLQNQTITSTGILATSSTPRAAKVYVNGELKGVTDLNLNLAPGKYTVEIKKDGFTNWSKEVSLKGEIVMTVNALLFPKNPSLSPLTSTGVVKAINLDQTGKIMLFIQGDDQEKNGIYMFESTQRTLSFATRLKPILLLSNAPQVDLLTTNVYFSPDFSQAIIEYTVDTELHSYLISLDQENTIKDLIDTTTSKSTFITAWDERRATGITKILETFPDEITKTASDSFRIISFSPDETKIIYQAKEKLELPLVIDPPLIGANQTSEERTLKKNSLYMYDKKEDKNIPLNLEIGSTDQKEISESHFTYPLQWYPDSRHIVFLQKDKIVVADYDGTNKRTVYSGPFQDDYFLITSNSTLIVLTNLNPQNNPHPDVYEVGIQ